MVRSRVFVIAVSLTKRQESFAAKTPWLPGVCGASWRGLEQIAQEDGIDILGKDGVDNVAKGVAVGVGDGIFLILVERRVERGL